MELTSPPLALFLTARYIIGKFPDIGAGAPGN
jgi:hypothetical protein